MSCFSKIIHTHSVLTTQRMCTCSNLALWCARAERQEYSKGASIPRGQVTPSHMRNVCRSRALRDLPKVKYTILMLELICLNLEVKEGKKDKGRQKGEGGETGRRILEPSVFSCPSPLSPAGALREEAGAGECRAAQTSSSSITLLATKVPPLNLFFHLSFCLENFFLCLPSYCFSSHLSSFPSYSIAKLVAFFKTEH